MRKKLVKQGHSTLTLTIPSKWVRENKLKPGDELELETNKNCLFLSTTSIPEEEAINLDLTNLGKTSVNWLLAATYKKGFDVVNVKYRDNIQLREISERIKSCLKNYEIVEHTKSSVVIKSISNHQEENFNILLRRIFLVNLSFFESVLEALESGKSKSLLDATHLEETNDSLVNACQRIIVKNRNLLDKERHFLYVIIWQLEKIADSLKHFCQEISKQKKIEKNFSDKFKQVKELYENFYSLYYKFDSQKLNDLIETKKDLLTTFEDENDFYFRLMIEQILDLSGSFFALNIN